MHQPKDRAQPGRTSAPAERLGGGSQLQTIGGVLVAKQAPNCHNGRMQTTKISAGNCRFVILLLAVSLASAALGTIAALPALWVALFSGAYDLAALVVLAILVSGGVSTASLDTSGCRTKGLSVAVVVIAGGAAVALGLIAMGSRFSLLMLWNWLLAVSCGASAISVSVVALASTTQSSEPV